MDDDRLPRPSDPVSAETLDTVLRFHEAWNDHDVGRLTACITGDSVFENTFPAPDGERFQGREAVGAFWTRFFQGSPQAHIDIEEIFACGDRCTMRWRFAWVAGDGIEGHIRGVDVFRVRAGKVAEKLSYVKG